MKKSICSVAVVAMMSLFAASCNNSAPKVDEKSASVSSVDANMKIAYVEVDSIMTQYKFCKEYSAILEKKGQNIQNTLNSKGTALQNAVNKFQQDIQNNQYTQQQAESVQASLQKQQSDLQALQQRLSSEFQSETEKFNNALRDSIQHYLTIYNKDKKFSLILSKAGDNILYADKTYDITNEIITGLNKAYKGMPAEKKK
ncbi:MAG: OmpH family outer membrane protein [Prevotella sp.]|nr:OmpH family outer membrane protein [Prevotella sp.]